MKIKELQAQIKEKDRRIKELEGEVASLTALVTKLLARIEELERRLGLNSANSSKPPSSDGLQRVSRTQSLKKTNAKKFGGQDGHKGNTLKQVENPDVTNNYDPESCVECGSLLKDVAVTDIIERQEVDIDIKKQIISHKSSVKICNCGKRNVGVMPQHLNAPIQFSTKIKAIGTYLTNQFISKSRIEQMFNDLFTIKISDTTLIAFDVECAEKLKPFYDTVESAIKEAFVKHADETGVRIAGKTNWLHVLCTELMTYYRAEEKRGSVPEEVVGILVHDHWKPYFTLALKHALCNAHLLRELNALIEIEKEFWAKKMYDLLIYASKLTKPSTDQQNDISEKYDAIVTDGLQYHENLGKLKEGSRKKRIGHNLLLRFQNFKNAVLLFLYQQDVPFTNNLAERDIRMAKLQQKVSGGHRTFNGAQSFAIIRSLISTAQKQAKNIFETLCSIFDDTFDLFSLVPT